MKGAFFWNFLVILTIGVGCSGLSGGPHVFAELKSRMGLLVRTIGIARAEATITLANMDFNMKRWIFLDARTLPA